VIPEINSIKYGAYSIARNGEAASRSRESQLDFQ